MKVCIAEKPSVAREIAQILGAKSRKDGYLEGNGYQVTWTFGHFCTLKMPEDYDPALKKWNLQALPILPEKFETKLISGKGVRKQFGVIRKLCKSATLVINCGDAGQEGKLIQRWVLKEAKYKGRVLRLWISSLTPEAIRDGFQNLRPAADFDNLFYAGSARAIGDWLLGMNATRLYTLKFGAYKQVFSIGRVQTPTLAMLVRRFKEIENFVPEPYWELQTLYREVVFSCQKGRFSKESDGRKVLEQVADQPFAIISFEKKKGKEYPPRLFDLTSLQVHCNKRFGYSADRTLGIVQKLYEQKVVTYPRVDTTYLPSDLYPKAPGILARMTGYTQFTQSLLGKPLRKSAKVFNDKKVTDHHAIIPTGVQKSLSPEQQNVYDAIARRFIACFYPDCLVANTTVIGESAGIRFKATGKEILEPGWRVLFPKNTKNKKEEEEKILPVFKQGETGPHQPELFQKMTQPPKHYTEATLLRAMETAGKQVDDAELRELMKANGIGRPSTRANIIETLFKRKYIQRRKKTIIATPTGIQLIDTIEYELLKSAELTGQWEKQLREIEQGSYQPQRFIREMKEMVAQLTLQVRQRPSGLRINPSPPPAKPLPKKRQKKLTDPAGLTCPKCIKGELLRGKTAYGCSRWKEGCQFRLPFRYLDKKISEKQLLRLLKHGCTVLLKGFVQNGKKINGRLRFDNDFQIYLDTPRAPAPDQCPKCKAGRIIKGKSAYGCSRWKEGCDLRVDFDLIRERAAGQVLTRELVLSLIQATLPK